MGWGSVTRKVVTIGKASDPGGRTKKNIVYWRNSKLSRLTGENFRNKFSD